MIYFKRFPLFAIFIMTLLSCNLTAKNKLSKNTTKSRSLASIEEPMYQIFAEDFRTAHSTGPILEIFGGKTQTDRPYKTLADSDCLWVRESDFKRISLRIMRLKQPQARGHLTESRLICSASSHKNKCEPAHYIFDGSKIQYEIKDFHTDSKDVFMKTRKTSPWSNYIRCQLYEAW